MSLIILFTPWNISLHTYESLYKQPGFLTKKIPTVKFQNTYFSNPIVYVQTKKNMVKFWNIESYHMIWEHYVTFAILTLEYLTCYYGLHIDTYKPKNSNKATTYQ